MENIAGLTDKDFNLEMLLMDSKDRVTSLNLMGYCLDLYTRGLEDHDFFDSASLIFKELSEKYEALPNNDQKDDKRINFYLKKAWSSFSNAARAYFNTGNAIWLNRLTERKTKLIEMEDLYQEIMRKGYGPQYAPKAPIAIHPLPANDN